MKVEGNTARGSTLITEMNSDISHQKSYKEVWKRLLAKIRAQKLLSLQSEEMFKQHETFRFSDDLYRDSTFRYSFIESSSRSKYLIHPHNKFYLCWLLLMTISLFYIATIGLIFSSFNLGSDYYAENYIEVLIDSLFLLDVIITSQTMYFNKDNILIKSRKRIFFNYLKTWLIPDLFVAMPINLLVLTSAYDVSDDVFKRLVKLRMFIKLFRLVKIVSILKKFLLIEKIDTFISLYRKEVETAWTLLIFILGLNIVACLFYSIAYFLDFSPDTWVAAKNLQDKTIYEKYISSLYWALTTMASVGYGDITPQNPYEKLLAMGWMFVGVFVISYSVGNLMNIINRSSLKEQEKFRMIDIAKKFLCSTQLKGQIKNRVIKKLANCADCEAKDGIFKLFENVPSDIKYEIAMNINNKSLSRIPFFTLKDRNFIGIIGPRLEIMSLKIDKILWKENEYAGSIVFVVDGSVKMLYKESLFSIQYQGQYCGDTEVIFKIPRKFSVVSCGCRLLQMKKNTIKIIKEKFPHYWKEMNDSCYKRSMNLVNSLSEMMLVKKFQEGSISKINKETIASVSLELYDKIFYKNNGKKKFYFDYLHQKLVESNNILENMRVKYRDILREF